MSEERTADWSGLALGFGLAAIAGCSDSIAFLSLHGFFASFMSGNSTRLAIGLAQRNLHDLLEAAVLIGLFVGGVLAGALIAAPGRVLMTVSALLLISAVASLPALALPRHAPILVLVPALGAMNNVVQRVGKVSVTATYITGTLVRLGQELAQACKGGPRWDWLPYAMLWSSLLAGAVTGAALFPLLGLRALWLPAACVLLLTIWRLRGRS
ncbi:DUF1275 domain-containing protein [Acetobacteraceae bacterium KSS8]|uniref:DUF1275 domain-containing protein n=1 Tax=Endosaccharibacter trunci TaxID=2812733 RepID=A0ABT1W471_9PROT|nr:DUF1275 domain-containing protein [Acetobacteraceae bacterium KSS8]